MRLLRTLGSFAIALGLTSPAWADNGWSDFMEKPGTTYTQVTPDAKAPRAQPKAVAAHAPAPAAKVVKAKPRAKASARRR
jgi:hypothetical protein